MKRISHTGFTLVELLIVIVVIAILATVTIIAYNGIQGRATMSRMRQDLASVKKALELYKIDNGSYPNSANCVNADSNAASGWCGWNQGTGDSFVPGLSPKYASTLPNLDPSLPTNDTYLYKSADVPQGNTDGGTKYYSLIRFRAAGLRSYEMQNNQDLWTGDGYDGIAWGYKSEPGLANW